MFDVDTRYHNVPVKVIEFINCFLIMNVNTSIIVSTYFKPLQTLKLKEQDYLGEATCVLSEVNQFSDCSFVVVWSFTSATAFMCTSFHIYFFCLILFFFSSPGYDQTQPVHDIKPSR